MKEQFESAIGEMKKLRNEVDVAKRRADIAERDLKVRVGVSSSGSSGTSNKENTNGPSQEDQNELTALRKQSEEMTKLLYEKQRQLESLQGEKQTWSMRLERAKEEFMNSAKFPPCVFVGEAKSKRDRHRKWEKFCVFRCGHRAHGSVENVFAISAEQKGRKSGHESLARARCRRSDFIRWRSIIPAMPRRIFRVLVFHSYVRLLFVAQVATQRAHC